MKSQICLKCSKKLKIRKKKSCPVCGGNECEDAYECLKEARFVMEEEDFRIESVERCGNCQKKHPYEIPKGCRK